MEYFRGLLTNKEEEAQVLLYGLPFDGATSIKSGAGLAPSRMRELSHFLPPVSWDGTLIDIKINDCGDCQDFLSEETDAKIKALYAKNKFMLFLGGDHSVSIKTQKAFLEKYKDKKVGIIHFDAHADICDVYDNSKMSHACVNRRAVDNGLHADDIVYIGLRSWEIQELEFFSKENSGVMYSMAKVRQMGVDEVLNAVVKKFKEYDAIYLSFDIDALDPSASPGTGTPEAGGLQWLEAAKLVKAFITQLHVVTMDVVEVSPPLDINDITSWAGLKLIYEALSELSIKMKMAR